MQAEEYLERIKMIDVLIVNKNHDYARWVELSKGLGGTALGERVQTTRNLHQMQDAVHKYMSIEDLIEALKRERQDIIDTIERLPFDEYDVLYKLYVLYDKYTRKEIAYERHKSYSWVKWQRKKGLEHLQGILDAK